VSIPRGVTVSEDALALRSVPAWVDVVVGGVVVIGLMMNLPLIGYGVVAAAAVGVVLWARIRVEITETGIERSGGGLTTTIPWADVRRVGWSADSSLLIVICAAGLPGSVPLFRLTTRLFWGPTNAQRVDAVIEAIAQRIPASSEGSIDVRTVEGSRQGDDNDAATLKAGSIKTCDD
jgi:hypothetical protein